jgi:hypothetical protein
LKLCVLLGAAALAAGCTGDDAGHARTPGQTSFTTEERGERGGRGEAAADGDFRAAAGAGGAAGGVAAPSAAPAPGGRVAEVKEADIYRIDGNRLFYLNTYRGFVAYDLADPKNPQRLGRLPVFGYPVEMYVEGNTVYALLRDALYLTQVGDKPQFQRHNVSQLVAIDVADPRNPRVLKTVDIVGQLHEGVSRKIDDTIYVVSQMQGGYSWGWRGHDDAGRKDQAWVYSFDVSNPQDLRAVDKLQLFEGGSVEVDDAKNGVHFSRGFGGVAISATSNALMVVENWYTNSYANRGGGACGAYDSNQLAIVSIVDVSDPTGKIKRHTRFETVGALRDQFKQTYVYDEAKRTGTYYGIFARQVWRSSNCQGESFTQNTIEAWDVSDGNAPKKLGARDFGKPNETVRGTAFDVDRKVAYAITAQQVDPLYAIGLSDPTRLPILSAVDGLSGDISLFRLVEGGKFLLAVGRDTSQTCTGFDDGGTPGRWWGANIAVSLIDVRDAAKVRLVQRRCVAIENASWVSSGVTWNLDQAHKMIGMHSDAGVNVVSVPVSYAKRTGDERDWYWYSHETAVGLMTWDLSKYDDTKDEKQQTVLENFGTFVHPHGEVRRTVLFRKEGPEARRMMLNLSDTHVSIADLQDLKKPKLESTIELAPYYDQIFRFGDHIVEQTRPRPWSDGPNDVSEFRVKRAGGDVGDRSPAATFSVGQVQRVIKHGERLVLFREARRAKYDQGGYVPSQVEAVIYDLRDPTKPRAAGRVAIPAMSVPYARFYCGVGAYWGGYWFDQAADWATTDRGLVFFTEEYLPRADGEGQVRNKLVFLDLQNVDAPRVDEVTLPGTVEWGSFGLVSDPVDPKGFFVSHRTLVSETTRGDETVRTHRYFAQRWEPTGAGWSAKYAVNLPGPLARTFGAGGRRMFLSRDHAYRQVRVKENDWRHHVDVRLALLREVKLGGGRAAELLDTRTFTDVEPSGLVVDGGKLFVSARPAYYGYDDGDVASGAPGGGGRPQPSWEQTSDRLMIFDLSGGRLAAVYDQPTRAYGVEIMGTHQGRLFLNLEGDGVLVLDVADAAKPRAVRFLRTLGWGANIEFSGNDAYVASGHFGVAHLPLGETGGLPLE